ncbi:uncharacterized protein LOC126825609 [Patella vulgata]|uniref:uncharacterized protein LOC126825609 n=1 Tax=Patella vulgata TaxID=6465 RepID=UPI0024A8F4E1|nr:uncharacterized protein LOC126825609 [Patella vulgata]
MGLAAENNGLTIQYCMADPRDALTSLEIPVVTQARASEDYHPGNNNWRLGLTSIFADSLGVAPFKDNFWTTTYQAGNKYNLSEPNTELIAAVATLSTGPVGPADKIGFSNAELIMRSCDADGLILKPNKPAMAIDAQILELAFKNGIGPAGEVWSTYSMINDNYFHILLAADMTTSYTLMPSQIGSLPTYIMENSQVADSAVVPVPFTEDQPLNLTTACTKSNFCLYHTSMQFSLSDRNVIIYGEFSKWVPMSRNRVISFTVGTNDIQLELQGAYMEMVTFLFFEDMNPVYVKCQIGDSGRATMSLVDRQCQQL